MKQLEDYNEIIATLSDLTTRNLSLPTDALGTQTFPTSIDKFFGIRCDYYYNEKDDYNNVKPVYPLRAFLVDLANMITPRRGYYDAEDAGLKILEKQGVIKFSPRASKWIYHTGMEAPYLDLDAAKEALPALIQKCKKPLCWEIQKITERAGYVLDVGTFENDSDNILLIPKSKHYDKAAGASKALDTLHVGSLDLKSLGTIDRFHCISFKVSDIVKHHMVTPLFSVNRNRGRNLNDALNILKERHEEQIRKLEAIYNNAPDPLQIDVMQAIAKATASDKSIKSKDSIKPGEGIKPRGPIKPRNERSENIGFGGPQ